MRFTLLTPGTGHFYCGSCLRDDALGRALRGAGDLAGAQVALERALALDPGDERTRAELHRATSDR